jgi:hypothetical protein
VSGVGFAGTTGQSPNDEVAGMLERVFAPVAPPEQSAVVYKDELERVYLAFYMSTYAEVREVRAYAISFRNLAEFTEEQSAIDGMLAAGAHAEAFDGLIGIMRLDLGSKYVSDVGLDGVHEGTVTVGTGSMQDRFHRQVFADHAAANAAYMHWIERALALGST